MFERFTERARHAFVAANDEARTRGYEGLGTEHLLLGLLHDPDSDAGRALQSLGVTLERACEQLDATGRVTARDDRIVEFTPRAKDVLEHSLREALRLDAVRIGTGHLVLGLLDTPESRGARMLTALHVDAAVARVRVTETIGQGAEAGERGPVVPVVVPELSPQAREALRTAFRLGTTYVGGKYLPVRMLRHASTARRVARSLGAGTATPAAAPPATGTELGPGTSPVPATCSSCGTPSPACGTLYTTAGGALVCERCVDRAG